MAIEHPQSIIDVPIMNNLILEDIVKKNLFDYHSVFMLSTFCTLRKGMWICWRSGPDGPDGPGSSHATQWDLVGCHDVMMSWQDEQWFNDTIMDFFLCLGLIWCWFFVGGVGGRREPRGRKKRSRPGFRFFVRSIPADLFGECWLLWVLGFGWI